VSTAARPHVVILGAGPAGLGAAYRLAKRGDARVTLVEQRSEPGGNAGSFEIDGIPVDYGSHRLHPECAPEVLSDLRELLGDDLLVVRRHGRIRLKGRWIHFPLRPLDLIRHLPPGFAAGVARDMALKPFRGKAAQETFASVMEQNLGRTLCRDFYFPYARKLWGLAPEAISPVQAQKRVSANSAAKLARRVLAPVPGLGSHSSRLFLYPRGGYGQISSRLLEESQRMGVTTLMNTRVTGVEHASGRVAAVRVETRDGSRRIRADHVWSTVPVTLLARLLAPDAPAEVLAAAGEMSFQGMALIYLTLETSRFTEHDAHYFPDEATTVSRLSEPKNYARRGEPAGRTVLCAEVPCAAESETWRMNDETLGEMVLESLASAGLPVRAKVAAITVRRIPHAYPVYRLGFERHFDTIDRWLGNMDGLLTFGRQGLFAHDNTHHALDMAYSAARCLRADGSFDRGLWNRYRVRFSEHVVVD